MPLLPTSPRSESPGYYAGPRGWRCSRPASAERDAPPGVHSALLDPSRHEAGHTGTHEPSAASGE